MQLAEEALSRRSQASGVFCGNSRDAGSKKRQPRAWGPWRSLLLGRGHGGFEIGNSRQPLCFSVLWITRVIDFRLPETESRLEPEEVRTASTPDLAVFCRRTWTGPETKKPKPKIGAAVPSVASQTPGTVISLSCVQRPARPAQVEQVRYRIPPWMLVSGVRR